MRDPHFTRAQQKSGFVRVQLRPFSTHQAIHDETSTPSAGTAAMSIAPAFADSPADRWNLAEIYPSVTAWNDDATKLDAQIKVFAQCKGHLGDSAGRFKQCLDLQADMTKRYYRMAAYSSELLSEDTGSSSSLELDQKADLLGNRLTEASAFVDPEILRIGKDRIARFIKTDPSLAIYRFPLDQVLRKARILSTTKASRLSPNSA
jgi:oligoendopeptidase F